MLINKACLSEGEFQTRYSDRTTGLTHYLGGCPRIESLLRKSGFWPIFPIKFVQYSKYSSHLIEKMNSKPLSLATASILGQPPSEKCGMDYYRR